jgi:hypothetical protein
MLLGLSYCILGQVFLDILSHHPHPELIIFRFIVSALKRNAFVDSTRWKSRKIGKISQYMDSLVFNRTGPLPFSKPLTHITVTRHPSLPYFLDREYRDRSHVDPLPMLYFNFLAIYFQNESRWITSEASQNRMKYP